MQLRMPDCEKNCLQKNFRGHFHLHSFKGPFSLVLKVKLSTAEHPDRLVALNHCLLILRLDLYQASFCAIHLSHVEGII